MSEKHVYEYAVIRVLPKVEREEFINVGIIIFSKQAKYLKSRYIVNENKLKLLSNNDFDFESIYNNLTVFNKICSGHKDGGIIATLDMAERFRWLTAIKSTMIQTSRPHPGCSSNLDQTLETLFNELVL